MDKESKAALVNNMQVLWKAVQLSWQRRTDKELHPRNIKGLRALSHREMTSLKREKVFLVEFVSVYMDYLQLLFVNKPYCILLCDDKGVALECRTYEINVPFKTGMMMAKDYIGINAVGMCMIDHIPTMVMNDEHDWPDLKDKSSFAVPILDANGNLMGILGAILNYSDGSPDILALMMVIADFMKCQWQYEAEILSLKTSLAAAENMGENIQNNAAVLSHEVRNSISTLSAYIQLMQLENLIDNERADKMIKEMTRVNRMIQDFRRLAKYNRFNFRVVSLSDLIERAIGFVNPKAQLKNIKVEINIKVNESYVNADVDAIEQVLINLIENAIQAIDHEHGCIRISLDWAKRGSRFKLSIEDNGCGISEEGKANLFKLFFTTKEEGSGIGLVFCRDVIKAHGGSIDVDSHLGQGTVFIITIPAA